MTGTIAILTKPFATKAEGKAITTDDTPQQPAITEISLAEIRQRQISMLNALLCCAI